MIFLQVQPLFAVINEGKNPPTILVLHKLELTKYVVCTKEHEFVGVDVNKRTLV
jgi:hypothetical protein